MFKPEYIIEDIKMFGYIQTVHMITAKFIRMGKVRKVAEQMATELVTATFISMNK